MPRVFLTTYPKVPAWLRIHVRKGVNLAIRDLISKSSDPYVTIKIGKQKLKTRVVKKNVNPEWNQYFTVSVADPSLPIKIFVYDKDRFSRDDKMGEAEFEIGSVLEDLKRWDLESLPSGTTIMKVQPNSQNCLAEESCIIWTGREVVQNMVLRLRKVKRGVVELQLQWSKV